jgi:hypothetical protein
MQADANAKMAEFKANANAQMAEYKADADAKMDAKMAEYKADTDAKMASFMNALSKKSVNSNSSTRPTWPANKSELRDGVNDTWNVFQSANKGRSVTPAEWKSARMELLAESNGIASHLAWPLPRAQPLLQAQPRPNGRPRGSKDKKQRKRRTSAQMQEYLEQQALLPAQPKNAKSAK